MSFMEIIDTIFFKSLELLFEMVYVIAYRATDNPGLSIIALSICMNVLILPLYMRADAIQREQHDLEKKLQRGAEHIKRTFRGDERLMMLRTYYRQNRYKPVYSMRSAASLLLQIPFFIAAYRFLSELSIIEGASFGPITDLGKPDGMLILGGVSLNVIPFIMTAVNLVSCVIFTKGEPFKSKLQLYGMALFFLVFLYKSPSGLVFYWTLNNIFSLGKTIFYKLKNSDWILSILLSVLGVFMAVYGYHPYSLRTTVFMLGVAALMELPLIWMFLKGRLERKLRRKAVQTKEDRKIFFAGAVFLAVLTGTLIPSAVIKASPLEFADITYFYHPLWYIVSASCLSFGTLVVWMGVFYFLAKPSVRAHFEKGVWLISGVALTNYMFFGKNLGILTNRLVYVDDFGYRLKDMLWNAAVVTAVMIALYLLYRYWKKGVLEILTGCLFAICCMAFFNMAEIRTSVRELNKEEEASAVPVEFKLSRMGENVIVIMLDRAMGAYIPYLFEEKPELKEMFSGFTYYSNVVSFGSSTNIGTPSLFGGYEYTPVEMNKRSKESLESKHNEALKVMPVLFSESGFDVTVCDPPYAGYQWIPDLSIYDEYPGIEAYTTEGRFTDGIVKETVIQNNKKIFFCHGVFKIAPVCMQDFLYDYGRYFCVGFGVQATYNLYTATGISSNFINSYSVLGGLPLMTDVVDEDKKTFLMLANTTTHEPMMLQEPEYAPAMEVDNSDYERENQGRFTVDGRTLKMETVSQMIHYQTNMAAMLKLGEWFGYMKRNGVYDNTRIIIVSDHGGGLGHFGEWQAEEGFDIGPFYPLMMVKDFNSSGFAVDEKFMTLADVPTLATENVIEEPVNPFTERTINSGEKTAHDQYICGSGGGLTFKSEKDNVFEVNKWYAVHDDMRVPDNWRTAGENTVLPNE